MTDEMKQNLFNNDRNNNRSYPNRIADGIGKKK